MVDSRETSEHVLSYWQDGFGTLNKIHYVWPPCDMLGLGEVVREEEEKANHWWWDKMRGASKGDFRILSLGPFQPNQDRTLQILSLARLRGTLLDCPPLGDEEWDRVKLVMVGSVDSADAEEAFHLTELKALCQVLRIEENVVFRVRCPSLLLLLLLAIIVIAAAVVTAAVISAGCCVRTCSRYSKSCIIFQVNVSNSELKDEMDKCSAGIHTKKNDLFSTGSIP